MQAGPELRDGLKERQVPCIVGTMGFHVALMIHTYLYVAHRLWDTDRILGSYKTITRAQFLQGPQPHLSWVSGMEHQVMMALATLKGRPASYLQQSISSRARVGSWQGLVQRFARFAGNGNSR